MFNLVETDLIGFRRVHKVSLIWKSSLLICNKILYLYIKKKHGRY